jgi:hypothetical protein
MSDVMLADQPTKKVRSQPALDEYCRFDWFLYEPNTS